jgi:peroxiredoxin
MLLIGNQAPAFSLYTTPDQQIQLSQLRGSNRSSGTLAKQQ